MTASPRATISAIRSELRPHGARQIVARGAVDHERGDAHAGELLRAIAIVMGGDLTRARSKTPDWKHMAFRR